MREFYTTVLLLGSMPLKTTLTLGQFDLGMKILAWFIHPQGIENKMILKYPHPTDIKKCKILM